MKRLTSLPVLASTLFLWTLSGAVGCGSNASSGSGGTGGADTGGSSTAGSDTGGSSTGGSNTGGSNTGGSSTGGSSTGGSSTGGTGGSALPECTDHANQVYGCVQSSKLPADPPIPFTYDEVGVVAAVRPPNDGEVCGPSYWYQLGWAQGPETMIDLTLSDGTLLTVGLRVPGMAEGAVEQGDTLSLHFSGDVAGFGGRLSVLELKKGEALVAAVGENMPAGLTPSEGEAECYSEDSLCGREEVAMDVAAADGTKVSIPNGQSAEVDGLTVTNDRYIHNYDTSGGCNFGLSLEYLMSATAAQ